VSVNDVPGIAVLRAKLQELDVGLSVTDSNYLIDRFEYTLRLAGNGREGLVTLPRDLLEDLRDNATAATSKYSRELVGRLTEIIRGVIESTGLIAFSESVLKYKLLRYIDEETKNKRPVHKYNAIGRGTPGDFERWAKVTLTQEEKDTLIWVWNELMRLRLIAPTGTDLVNPDDWVRITDKGASAVAGRTIAEYSEIEEFINKGEVYTAYQSIKAIMKQAKQALLIVDPHVDDSLIDLVATLDSSVEIRLMVTHLHGDFKNAYAKLQSQRGKIEARQSSHFHDRFIVADGVACYQLGASIKDAGAKATVIDRKSDSTRDRVLDEARAVWNSATPV
jgi:hypothetical protein